MPLRTTPHHSTTHYTMPTPFNTTPRHATPRHATPRHATPRHSTPLHSTPLHSTPLHNTTQHNTTHYSTTHWNSSLIVANEQNHLPIYYCTGIIPEMPNQLFILFKHWCKRLPVNDLLQLFTLPLPTLLLYKQKHKNWHNIWPIQIQDRCWCQYLQRFLYQYFQQPAPQPEK